MASGTRERRPGPREACARQSRGKQQPGLPAARSHLSGHQGSWAGLGLRQGRGHRPGPEQQGPGHAGRTPSPTPSECAGSMAIQGEGQADKPRPLTNDFAVYGCDHRRSRAAGAGRAPKEPASPEERSLKGQGGGQSRAHCPVLCDRARALTDRRCVLCIRFCPTPRLQTRKRRQRGARTLPELTHPARS